MSETPPAPPPPPAPVPLGPTMKALENLEKRLELVESIVKDQALEIARLKPHASYVAPAAPTGKKGGLLRER